MVMYDPSKPAQKQAVAECVDTMMNDALAMEGTVSVSSLFPTPRTCSYQRLNLGIRASMA